MNKFLFCGLLLAVWAGTNDVRAQGSPAAGASKRVEAASPRNIEVPEAEKLLKENKSVVVLDVRTPDEFKGGHIKGAKNVDFNSADFQKKLRSLDKKQPYLVHCASGGRSSKAREVMKGLGFESIYHLEGGMKAWEKAGKPVVKP